MTRSLLLALLLSIVGTATPAAAQQAPPEPVRVTAADTGRTVSLSVGQELQVDLASPSDGEHWQGPTTEGPLYLREYSEREDRTTATLTALRPSSEPVTLRARTDRPCFHSGHPCPQGFSTWTLDVVVGDGPPPDTSYDCYAMPTPSYAPGTVGVTEQDNGRRITVEQGSLVHVQLRGCGDPYVVPSADGPLFRSSADFRANGVSTATFSALGLGTTRITSTTDPACLHTATPCARASVLFAVEVEVVARVDDGCMVPMAIELEPPTITATGASTATVRTAAGVVVDLYAYTRPSTTYRLVRSQTSDADGVARFVVRPPANTRLHAQKRGCAPGPSTVLNVRTALTLEVERTAPRTYLFSGDSLPARPGGLIVSLYRVESDGRQVLTAQARADEATGQWQVLRRFTGTGRFGFVVRTGQDLQNAPGTSNVRSLLVF